MQNTLFGEPIKKEETERESEYDMNLKDTDSDYHTELNTWTEKCKTDNESYLYYTINYACHNDLGGIREWLTMSESFERIWHGIESSYGGSWGHGSCDTLEDIKKLCDRLREWYAGWITIPYDREHADDRLIRGVRRENIRIFFSAKAKEYIKRVGGWDTSILMSELISIPEVILDDKTYEPIKKFWDMEKESTDVQHKIYELEHILQKVLDNNVELEITTITTKHKELSELRARQKILEQEINNTRKRLYHWED